MRSTTSGILKSFTLTLVLILLTSHDIKAEIVVYPVPAGATASTQYSVLVNNQNSYVFPSTSMGLGASRGDFTSFSTSVTVPVTVTTNVDISSVTIRPLKLGITYTKTSARTIKFNVPSDCNLSVEINGNTDMPLFVFSNPLEVNVPKPTDTNVRYYAAGQIYTENITPKAGQTIYIAGGAIVRGNITCTGVSNFTVRGRGILDSSVNPTMSRTVRIVGGSNITFEGIVFHNVQSWGVVFGTCNGVEINNIKVISTPDGESDALDIVGSQNVTVNGGFFRSEDDCICVKSMKEGYNLGVGNPQNININGATIFNGHRGNALEIGYELNGIVGANGHSSVRDIYYSNIDIIHKGTAVDGSTNRRSAMSIHNNENARVSNVSYTDIRIEDCEENYLYLAVIKPDTSSLISGSIDSVLYKNIQITGGDLTLPSAIYGYNASSKVQNITFDGFKVGSNVITSASKLKLAVNSFSENIVFKKTLTDANQIDSLSPKVYPTTCDNNLFVVGCDSAAYTIVDVTGKTFLSGIVKSKSISVASLSSGTYLIKFTLNKESVTRKFVKR
ncbi:MAG: T9SS type A sorting domain-containing protein [Paludibacter sp.]